MKNNLVERVLKTIRQYEMLKPGETVLVAVSGGSDSVFLLLALNYLKSKLKLKKLIVCNLDHGIRAHESAEDSLFVKKMAEESDLGFIHKKINLSEKRSKDLSVEELAREERYRFFRDASKAAKADVITTGHTLDDQAETVLMRIIKGASLKGIVGISPVRSEGDIRLSRPLFDLEKKEIEKYLDDRNVAYRVDSSNLKPVYFRNIVRKDIIPYLEKYNPRIKRALCSLAEHLREDFEFISQSKQMVRGQGSRGKDGSVKIELKDIVVQPKALQKEILRDSLEKSGGEVKRLSFRHWKELEELIRQKRKGASIDLPGDIRITRTANTLIFKRRSL